MAMQGADPAQLRQLARRFDMSANQLQQLAAQISSKINETQAWRGPDADRFRGEWNSHYRTLMVKATSALHEGSKALEQNAQEQEHASQAVGTGTGSGSIESFDLGDLKGAAKEVNENPILKGVGRVAGGVLGTVGVIGGVHDIISGIDDGDWKKAGDGWYHLLQGGVALATVVDPELAPLTGMLGTALIIDQAIFDHVAWPIIDHVAWPAISHIPGVVSDAGHTIAHVNSSIVHGAADAGKSLADGAKHVTHALDPHNW